MAKHAIENRRFLRFPVSIPVNFDERDENYSTICSNISQKGVYVETSEKLSKGDVVCLHLSLTPKSELTKVLGEVVWVVKTHATDLHNKAVKGFGIRILANMKDSLDMKAGILEKDRWKPDPDKDTRELMEPLN